MAGSSMNRSRSSSRVGQMGKCRCGVADGELEEAQEPVVGGLFDLNPDRPRAGEEGDGRLADELDMTPVSRHAQAWQVGGDGTAELRGKLEGSCRLLLRLVPAPCAPLHHREDPAGVLLACGVNAEARQVEDFVQKRPRLRELDDPHELHGGELRRPVRERPAGESPFERDRLIELGTREATSSAALPAHLRGKRTGAELEVVRLERCPGGLRRVVGASVDARTPPHELGELELDARREERVALRLVDGREQQGLRLAWLVPHDSRQLEQDRGEAAARRRPCREHARARRRPARCRRSRGAARR